MINFLNNNDIENLTINSEKILIENGDINDANTSISSLTELGYNLDDIQIITNLSI
jgi:hypothetical protein